MSLRQYLIFMAIGTAICWTAWYFVILNVDPTETGIIGLFFFYISFFLALTGTFSVIGFLARRWIVKNEDALFHHVRHTFRHAILVSSLVLVALILFQQKILNLWNGILLLIIFLALESIVFANRKFKNSI
jgi:hypothetical protein